MSQSDTPARKPRGFAAMDPEKVRAIASKGGKASHILGKAHQFTSEEARQAGRKGGTAPHVTRGVGRRGKSPPEVAPESDQETASETS